MKTKKKPAPKKNYRQEVLEHCHAVHKLIKRRIKPVAQKPRTRKVKVTLQLPLDLAEYYEHIRKEQGHHETFEAAILDHLKSTIADYFDRIAYQQNPNDGRLSAALNEFFDAKTKTKSERRAMRRIMGLDRWPWTGTKPKSFRAAKDAAVQRGRRLYKRFPDRAA